MKKKLLTILSVCILCIGLLTGCQTAVKSWGGSMIIELEPNTKLELITWKDNSLWYCTRPMRDDEIPETYTYQQDSNFGIIEGTVTIVESKE